VIHRLEEKNDRFVVVFLNKGLTFFTDVRSDEASKKNDAPTQLKDGPVLIIFWFDEGSTNRKTNNDPTNTNTIWILLLTGFILTTLSPLQNIYRLLVCKL
jgi:hypothetical protein